MPSGRARWLLAALVLLALVLDFLFYTGFYASDDIGYFRGAGFFVGDPGDGQLALTGDIRIGVTMPSALVYWITDGDIGWIAWFHTLYHLAIVLVAFGLGKLFKGERVGLIAAFLVATSPLFYLFAGAVFPDNPLALWIGLAIAALELTRQNPDMAPARQRLGYVAIGVFLGLGYTCNEKSLVLAVPVAIAIMTAAPTLKSWAWIRNGALVIAGLVAVMLLEVLILKAVTGQWIWRLGILQGFGDLYERKMAWQGTTPLERFDFAYSRRLAPHVPLSLWLLLAGSLAYFFVRKRSWTLLAFFWWPLLFITIGSTSLSAYRPPTLQTRYYSLVVLPAAIMTASLIVLAVDKWLGWKRTASWARSRYLVWTAAILPLVWMATREVKANSWFSGNLYKAGVVRGFVAAYEKALAEYPEYPIVLSPEYRQRMSLLLMPSAPPRVYAASYMTGPVAPPIPHIYLQAVENLQPPAEGIIESGDGNKLLRRTLHLVEPAPSRIAALKHGFWKIFAIQPRMPLGPPIRGSAVIQLVTRAPDDVGAMGIRAPLVQFGQQDGVRIKFVDDGYVVVWSKPTKLAVQYPDSRTYKRRPSDPSTQLDSPVERISLEFDVELMHGGTSHANFSLFGYTEGGEWSKSAEKIKLQSGDTRTVSLEVMGDAPMNAYKLRMSVDSKEPGALFLSTFRLRRE